MLSNRRVPHGHWTRNQILPSRTVRRWQNHPHHFSRAGHIEDVGVKTLDEIKYVIENIDDIIWQITETDSNAEAIDNSVQMSTMEITTWCVLTRRASR